jgi:hypothetical protein
LNAGVRRAGVAAALALGLTSTLGCARYSERVPAPIATLQPFVDRFERAPSIATWEAVHRHMRLGALDPRSQVAIVRGLSHRDVPPRLVDAAAVDMATYAWSGSLATIREQNLSAQSMAAADDVASSARLAWLLMALRAGYIFEGVDLSKMDLRDPASFVGQSMNLRGVNFDDSYLPGGVWRNSDLTGTSFERTRTDGTLVCDPCVWRGGEAPQRKTLLHGRWISN